MNQSSKQDAFKLALEEANRQWNTGAVNITQASKNAARKHKVNAVEVLEYLLASTKNKSN